MYRSPTHKARVSLPNLPLAFRTKVYIKNEVNALLVPAIFKRRPGAKPQEAAELWPSRCAGQKSSVFEIPFVITMNMKLRCDRIWRAWTLFCDSISTRRSSRSARYRNACNVWMFLSLPVLHASFQVKILSKWPFEVPFIWGVRSH
jgi:hypothetical protein